LGPSSTSAGLQSDNDWSSSGGDFDGEDDEEIDEDAAFNEDDWERYGDWFQDERHEVADAEPEEDAELAQDAADEWLEDISAGLKPTWLPLAAQTHEGGLL
jgi:hypothetical protein